jgi:molybdopterin molybdotransferase
VPGGVPEAIHLTYAEARARVLAAARPLGGEAVPIAAARGRALRRSLVAPHDLPAFDNTSMDGYALRAADAARATPERPVTLPVVEVLPAGRVAARPLGAGEAMRIMTGAPLPAGADAVIAFEDAERLEGPERVRVARPVRLAENVRPAGADLRAGEVAIAAGRELSAHDLALAGALGFSELEVGRRPRVAVVSTGDELLEPGEPPREGAVRDSNRPMLAMLAEEAGAETVGSRHVGDRPQEVAGALGAALESADVVLSIGGVSAGDFDPVKQSLHALGDVALWRVAMKPGRPQAFGAPGGRLFFGLPGNPASVACVFEALVRPALRALQGFAALDRPRLAVRCARAIESRAGRTDFVRASLAWREGAWWASPAGEQVSGHLTPQSRAHALLIVPAEAEALAEGAAAEALLWRWPEATA